MVSTVTTIVRRSAPHSPKVSTKLIEWWAERMLRFLDRSEAELSILLTDDKTIAKLNHDYRKKDRPTDVLSFHFDSTGLPSTLDAGWLLGDIVISLDTAARQATGRKRPLEEELRWLLAHGVLHLIGYDHADPEEKRVMVLWTRKLVRAAGDIPPEFTTASNLKTTSPRRKNPKPATTKAANVSRRKKTKPATVNPANVSRRKNPKPATTKAANVSRRKKTKPATVNPAKVSPQSRERATSKHPASSKQTVLRGTSKTRRTSPFFKPAKESEATVVTASGNRGQRRLKGTKRAIPGIRPRK
jgi:rRNA maturation RNase YbeY